MTDKDGRTSMAISTPGWGDTTVHHGKHSRHWRPLAAIGFVASAGALVTDWEQWRLVLIGVAMFSLLLTVLDYTVAYAGVVVNRGILIAVAVSVRM